MVAFRISFLFHIQFHSIVFSHFTYAINYALQYGSYQPATQGHLHLSHHKLQMSGIPPSDRGSCLESEMWKLGCDIVHFKNILFRVRCSSGGAVSLFRSVLRTCCLLRQVLWICLKLYAPCIILQYVYKPTRCTKFL